MALTVAIEGGNSRLSLCESTSFRRAKGDKVTAIGPGPRAAGNPSRSPGKVLQRNSKNLAVIWLDSAPVQTVVLRLFPRPFLNSRGVRYVTR
jgi:hypothetical protein